MITLDRQELLKQTIPNILDYTFQRYSHTENIKKINVSGKQKRHPDSKDFFAWYTGNAQHLLQAQHFKRHHLLRFVCLANCTYRVTSPRKASAISKHN